MKKYSIIIPFTIEDCNLMRSYSCLKKQQGFFDSLEIIIVSCCNSEKAKTVVDEIEAGDPERVIVVYIDGIFSLEELFEIGLNYCSGDYVAFINPGDVLNIRLFEFIDLLNDEAKDNIDMFFYDVTRIGDSFELLEDEPFDISNVRWYLLDSQQERLEALHKLKGDTQCYNQLYRRFFLIDSGISISQLESPDLFFWTMIFMAHSIVYIPEHGLFHYQGKEDEDYLPSVVADNLNKQIKYWDFLCNIPEIRETYKDVSVYQFFENYYLRTLKYAIAKDINSEFNLEIYGAMRLVCLNVEHNWIENKYIYEFSKYEIGLLQMLFGTFESNVDLYNKLYRDQIVSVIITTYNRAKKLARAIDNILEQTYQRFELIIVDDASTDDTQEIVKGYRDSRIKYFKNDINRGVSFSRNKGIQEAKGKYIVYQDDDDLCRLDRLEKEVDYLRNHEEVGMVYHETINHINRLENKNNGNIVMLPARKMPDVKKAGYIFPALLPWNFVACTSMMIRKECFEKIGLFDEKLFAFEDWDMTLRIAKEFNVGFIKEPLYDYYQSPNGLLFSSDEEHRKKVVHALEIIDKKYETDRKSFGIKSINK